MFTLTASALNAGAASALDPVTGTPEQFFGNDGTYKLYTFHLTIGADQYNKMEPPGGGGMARPGVSGDDRYPTGRASLEFEGKPWGELDVRYKGNSSFRSGGELKRPLKLEFEGTGDAKNKSRTFFGMTKLNLNNNAMDASQIREALAYDVFRYEGIPTPRTAFARVYLTVPGIYDNQYAGLYTVVEQIDQVFFKDRLARKTGPVVKPEGLYGMPYLGDSWSSYLIRYGAKSGDKVDSEDSRRFIAFVRFLNQATDEEFSKHIADYVDVDQFLRFLAVEVITVNLDSPLSMNHNYYVTLDPKTHKIIWIPWDMNLAFAGFGRGGGSTGQQDLSIAKPSGKGQFPLADRFLASPEYLKRYNAILRNIATRNFTVERLGDEIDRMASLIRDSVNEDESVTFTQFERQVSASPAALERPTDPDRGGGFGFGGFGRRGGPPLRQFLPLRIESVLEQLDGKREGFTSTGRGGFGGGPAFRN